MSPVPPLPPTGTSGGESGPGTSPVWIGTSAAAVPPSIPIAPLALSTAASIATTGVWASNFVAPSSPLRWLQPAENSRPRGSRATARRGRASIVICRSLPKPPSNRRPGNTHGGHHAGYYHRSHVEAAAVPRPGDAVVYSRRVCRCPRPCATPRSAAGAGRKRGLPICRGG